MEDHGENSERVNAILAGAGIDPDLSRRILRRVRQMDDSGGTGASLDIEGFPRPGDGALVPPQAGEDLIADISDPGQLSVNIRAADIRRCLDEAGIPDEILDDLEPVIGPGGDEDVIPLDGNALRTIGLAALPLVSYGILNGGSATSYADEKKNRSFNPELFDLYRPLFDRQAGECRGRAKGLTPGYINPDGSGGYSYIELKIRAALLLLAEHDERFPESRRLSDSRPESWPRPLFPLFQMTSSGNDGEIAAAYETYRSSPVLAALADRAGIGDQWFLTGVQPLIAAMTPSTEVHPRRPREFFLSAHGSSDSPLALPGGHGQNFIALEGVYRELGRRGKTLAYLGNVDNLGFVPDPVEIALMLLFGSPAGFDFSFKTAVDVKGGVLLRTTDGSLTCGDIGPAVSRKQVDDAQAAGTPILFNCATGLFSLGYLNRELERIQETLPLRVSDQDKDAGRYSQAEQVTWEVMGLIDGFLAFGVDKYRRFLAGKLIVENFMTSGISLDDPAFPAELRDTAKRLNGGFAALMDEVYRMDLNDGVWTPL
jgi:UTP--glucose-1-phosphate uridylyltransferase